MILNHALSWDIDYQLVTTVGVILPRPTPPWISGPAGPDIQPRAAGPKFLNMIKNSQKQSKMIKNNEKWSKKTLIKW